MLLTAALAVVPAAATTPAFAADVRSHPTVRSDDHPGPSQLSDQQRECMAKKGFGPMQHHPGDQPPGRDQMQKRWHDRMQAAKDCGVTGWPGPGRHWGPPMNEQQKVCMEQKGFGPGMHRPDQNQRPSREQMDKRRQAFHDAAQACGLQGPNKWHKGPAGPSGPGGPGKPA
ncbi:MAG TPA: hypothetical protein VGJ14_02545 [Sporichthyaceae bacterium]|jgi:hypothetical protein